MQIDVLSDGPPGPDNGRFVEIENDVGRSISVGEWRRREDGYWALRLTLAETEADIAVSSS
jgi:hypothetical protein